MIRVHCDNYNMFTPRACARDKVVGLYACHRRSCLPQNHHFERSRHLSDSQTSRSVRIGKKTGFSALQIVWNGPWTSRKASYLMVHGSITIMMQFWICCSMHSHVEKSITLYCWITLTMICYWILLFWSWGRCLFLPAHGDSSAPSPVLYIYFLPACISTWESMPVNPHIYIINVIAYLLLIVCSEMLV